MIDLKKLEKLIGLMVDNDLTEIDLDDGTEKVQLKRANAAGPVQMIAPPSAPVPAAPAPAATPPALAGGAPATPAAKGPTIDSPMVGTFYAASNPDSPAFVKPGDSVTADTVVCIIEAMKVFNEIKAEKAGKVKSVLVSNGDAVEFGQPLFELE
ncbi:MAG: acetyl-CoA carboxylase biotin carboxyl carrier protein [Phycisphaeraceae bacterium]